MLLKGLGIINGSRSRYVFTDTAILIGMAYVYLPLMVLPIYASMEKLDFRLVEAGYDLYATRVSRCCGKIIIPAGQTRRHRRLDPGLHSRRLAPM